VRPPGLFTGHNRPSDLSAVALAKVDSLGVFEDSNSCPPQLKLKRRRMDYFVFSGCGHGKKLEILCWVAILTVFSASGCRTYKGPRGASLVKSAVSFCLHGFHFGEVLSFAKVLGVSAT
jgi:hypothetical protein